jgi:hypothetical protein
MDTFEGLIEVKETVDHPKHYNLYDIETIDMMEKIWGKDATILFCKMTAFKYRMRMFLKDDPAEDFRKEQWYLDKAKEMKDN